MFTTGLVDSGFLPDTGRITPIRTATSSRTAGW
jgi:hypothetical protein